MIITPIIIGSGGGDPVRPADWLDISGLLSVGQQKIVGLYAVYEGGVNYLAFLCRAAYNVKIYDDIDLANLILNQDVADNTTFEAALDYDDFKVDCTRGYRQAIIIVTPQTANNLTRFNCTRHSAFASGRHALNWLDVRIVGTNVERLTECFGNVSTYFSPMLEEFHFIGSTAEPCAIEYAFAETRSFRKLNMDTSKCSSFNGLFYDSGIEVCTGITINQRAGSNAQYMFYFCKNLHTIKDMIITSTGAFTSWANLYQSLKYIGDIDFSTVTAAGGLVLGSATYRTLERSGIYGITRTHSYRYNLLSLAAIVEIFTNLGNAVAGAEIDVRDNPGAASLTATELLIAQNKGWNVLY